MNFEQIFQKASVARCNSGRRRGGSFHRGHRNDPIRQVTPTEKTEWEMLRSAPQFLVEIS
jgi:hypothetical protein